MSRWWKKTSGRRYNLRDVTPQLAASAHRDACLLTTTGGSDLDSTLSSYCDDLSSYILSLKVWLELYSPRNNPRTVVLHTARDSNRRNTLITHIFLPWLKTPP